MADYGTLPLNGNSALWQTHSTDLDSAAEVALATTITDLTPGCRVTDTVVAMLVGSTSTPYTLTLVIEDISDGSSGSIQVTADGEGAAKAVRLSDTQVAVLFATTTGPELYIKTFNISGVTPALDATSSGLGAAGDTDDTWDIAALSSTRAHVVLKTGASEVSVIGVTFGSGSIMIDGLDTTITTYASNNPVTIAALTASTSLICYQDTSVKLTAVVATDDTPPTLGTPAKLCDEAGVGPYSGVSPAVNDAGTLAMLSVKDSGGADPAAVPVGISGTALAVNSTLAASTGLRGNLPGGVGYASVIHLGYDGLGGYDMFLVTGSGTVDPLLGASTGVIVGAKDTSHIIYGGGGISLPNSGGHYPLAVSMSDTQAVVYYEDVNEDLAYKVLNLK